MVLVLEDGIEAIRYRIAELQAEHRDLDEMIARLAEAPGIDQLALQRFKKRKLRLKDQIAQLEQQLVPDIPA